MRFDAIESQPLREHSFSPIEITGRMTTSQFGDVEVVGDDGHTYKLAKRKDAALGGIRYYKQGNDVNKFTTLIGEEVVVKGVLDMFQDYGDGTTTIRVIRGPKITTP